MNINLESLGQAVELMGLGMAGIFIVLSILFLAVKILLKIFPSK